MPDFNIRIWDNERIYLVDFGRAWIGTSVPANQRVHPHKTCPDIDHLGYMDDAHANEHGPIISAGMGQGDFRVRFIRAEISTTARLYAVSNARGTVRVIWPNNGLLPGTRECTLLLRPVAAGRATINIHYQWPDGPIIGCLNVVIRNMHTVHTRVHLVTLNGNGQAASFLGRNANAGETTAQHHANRIKEIFEGVNHVWEPHGIHVTVDETVNTAWTNAHFGAPIPPPAGADTTLQLMRAMATSPNRSATKINVYLVNKAAMMLIPLDPQCVALGPPIAWAINIGARWPNNPGGHVGSGIFVDSSFSPFTGSILAHEFGHVFSLSSILTSGASAGASLQWHTDGDEAGPGGNTDGPKSRDDIITRRRLMYPYVTLGGTENSWRRDVGYGRNMGALVLHRKLSQDTTLDESKRAYDYVATGANLYAL
jgi:hypothetical protein